MDHVSASSLLRAVADPVRLRLLHLLHAHELSVGELVRILDLPQSSVSRHIKALRDERLVVDRASGPATYYRAALNAELGNGQGRLRQTLAEMLPSEQLPPTDRERLERVLALRASEQGQFFNQIGLQWDAMRESCFGTSFHLEAFLTLLPQEWTVADLGTGTGYLLPHLERHFQRVIAVDISQPMLKIAADRVKSAKAGSGKLRAASSRIEFHEGRLEKLPIAMGEVDLSLVILMLHHLPKLDDALRELYRITRRGGQVLLVDFHPHTNPVFQARMADERPGVESAQLIEILGEVGFESIRQHSIGQPHLPDHELAPLPRLYAVTAIRPGGAQDLPNKKQSKNRKGQHE